jgi:hypothetical protein
MKIQPTDNIKFGIYKGTKITHYGQCDYGVFRNKNIEIYQDYRDKTKLYYVSDMVRKWIKSKLIYFQDGVKRIIRSQNNN